MASVAIMLDGKNSLAHYSRAKARRAYGHFAGAMRDLQNCRLRTVVPGHLAGIDKVSAPSMPPLAEPLSRMQNGYVQDLAL